jgi:hypothetical protein
MMALNLEAILSGSMAAGLLGVVVGTAALLAVCGIVDLVSACRRRAIAAVQTARPVERPRLAA